MKDKTTYTGKREDKRAVVTVDGYASLLEQHDLRNPPQREPVGVTRVQS